ncbi:DUF6883 domain-containing protein [Thermosinus carboxydivorans]|uniref:DUF6883 domain-containing protein n=1 Tax=Thermosinus carboxydivorans TaxID=261685 RepID=UPI000592BE1F|nr:DUF6883 domain-containing protein [Thermosinus carboxydivorans]
MLDGMRQRDQVQKGGDEFLRKIDPANRRRLLGIEGDIAWLHGRDWRQYLRQWKGHEDPRPRLTKDDFKLQRLADNYLDPQQARGIKEKLLSYSLNSNHPVGKHKAIVFEKELGYTESNWEKLEKEILSGLTKFPAVYAGQTPVSNNPKYVVSMKVQGVNGATSTILTVWEQTASGEIRMVTAYVDK